MNDVVGKYIDYDKAYKIYTTFATEYIDTVNYFLIKNNISATQQQFDALYLLIYLTSNIKEPIGNLIKKKGINNISREEARGEMLNYFKKLKKWDKFKDGWTKRVDDVLDVWFDGDYERDY